MNIEKDFETYLDTDEGKLEAFCRMTYSDLVSIIARSGVTINYNINSKENIEALKELKRSLEESVNVLLKIEIKKERNG